MSSAPRLEPLELSPGYLLTVDVEEWYHTCLVPAYVRPGERPAGLAEELDWLLPRLLEMLDRAGRRATFFVLGEVAERHPKRVLDIAAAGHEIASHSFHHLRVGWQSSAELRSNLEASKRRLEDLIGGEVIGFRAPEWSFRRHDHPLLPLVAEAGYRYDSSLAPVLGAGTLANPRRPSRLLWPGSPGLELLELPPLTFAGALQLPAASWTGRLVSARRLERAAERGVERFGAAVFVVHPWEISGRPTPGTLKGFARFVHETGRAGYPAKFEALVAALPWQPIRDGLGSL
ncbi:MAG TPA: polysaccharide deacetylase family protein [Thermoanaerobaculia bacterium]|nr:polysaccharide deacetylase family protein [Thermoanaerobaculia bacterium]